MNHPLLFRAVSGVTFLLLLQMLLSFIAGPAPSLQEYKITGFAQGTNYHITYYAATESVTQSQTDSILQSLDSSLSIYKDYSLISRFNRDAKGIRMDIHLKKVLVKSLEIYHQTKGISDITIYPLMQAWGFGPTKSNTEPDSLQIASLLPCIGSGKLFIKGNWLGKTNPCIKIDVNGIAQGYSVDVIADYFEKKNIRDYIVEVGGELRVSGIKPSTQKTFRIGIEAPAKDSMDEPIINKIITFAKGAITTSGNYRKFHESKGKRIAHLMNPFTGYPLQNEMIAVTVWAKDAITADGYDNALMGMGWKKGMEFLKKHPDMEAYFIYRDADNAIKDTATQGFYKLMIAPK